MEHEINSKVVYLVIERALCLGLVEDTIKAGFILDGGRRYGEGRGVYAGLTLWEINS